MRLILLSIFVALVSFSFSQELLVKKSPLLDYLINSDANIGFIGNPEHNNRILLFNESPISTYPQLIVKTKNKLFIIIENTGRVFEYREQTTDGLKFKRIDSTIFFGYNSHAIPFVYHDTLFSFGGTGFWHKNGQLRYFSKDFHEWNIKQINEEVYADRKLFYFNPNEDILYYFRIPYTDQVTGKEFKNADAVKLDLSSSTNSKLGVLSKEVKQLFGHNDCLCTPVILPSLNGLLVNFSFGKQYLFNFKKNEVYRLNTSELKNLFFSNSNRSIPAYIFQVNDSLYFTHSADSNFNLKSVKISIKDFEKEPFPIFVEEEGAISANYPYYGFGLSLVLLAGITYMIRKRKNDKKLIERTLTDNHESETVFSPIELEIINKIIQNSKTKGGVSVEEINFNLGISKKSLEIQKKTRAESINKINHKFKIIHDLKDDLIERARSEEDKRFYKYVINRNNWRYFET